MEDNHLARFTDRNEGFICEHCGKKVLPSKSSCRNHCPYCLYSKHVDNMPGDRASECQGMMKPIGYELSSKKGIVLIFKCEKCGVIKKNISAYKDPIASDDYDLILSLTPKD